MLQNFPKEGSAPAFISTADSRSPGPVDCVTGVGVSPCWWFEFVGVVTLLLIRVDLATPLCAPAMLDLLFSAVWRTIPGRIAPVAVGMESRDVL